MRSLPSENDKIAKTITSSVLAGKSKCHPLCIIMAGGPASGKTTSRELCINSLAQHINDFVIIDPDEIREKIARIVPAQDLDESNQVKSTGGIVKRIMDELITITSRDRYNTILDRTGRRTKNVIIPINIYKKTGFRIVVCINLLDVETALGRNVLRYEQTGRHTDEDFIIRAYEEMSEVIPIYLNLDSKLVDGIFVYDNTTKIKLMMTIFFDVKGNRIVECDESACDMELLAGFCKRCVTDPVR